MNTGSAFSKPGTSKSFVHTFLVLVITFLLSSLPLFLGYLLKKTDPAQYGLIHSRKEDLELTYKEILFYASLVLALFVLSVAYRYTRKQGVQRILTVTALVYLSAACITVLADTIYYLIFASRITFSSFQTVLNTNPDEVREFIGLYLSVGRVLLVLLFAAGIWMIIVKRRWFTQLFSSRPFFISSLSLSFLGILEFIQLSHSEGNGLHNMRYWDIAIGEYNEYKEFNRRLAAEKNSHTLSPEYTGFYSRDTLPKTLVLVISESLSRRHMSLYGYPRKTTPQLDTNKSLVVFRNCVSQSALTIEAVPGLFFNGYLSRKINLISLCNKLGYSTTWISNQSAWGKGDGTIVLLSGLCKKQVFVNDLSDDAGSNFSFHYDDNVLKHVDQELAGSANTSKLIIVHLMGCHFDYEKRYPRNRAVFKTAPPVRAAVATALSEKIINAYDNAMHYHDSVVNEMVHIFSEHTKDANAALLFLSDHGEELYDVRDHAGHGYPPSKASSEIPCFVAFSDPFKKNYPKLPEIAAKRVHTAYSTSDSFYTLLDLLNIRSEKHRNRILKNSFFSPLYDSTRVRLVMGADYDKMRL